MVIESDASPDIIQAVEDLAKKVLETWKRQAEQSPNPSAEFQRIYKKNRERLSSSLADVIKLCGEG